MTMEMNQSFTVPYDSIFRDFNYSPSHLQEMLSLLKDLQNGGSFSFKTHPDTLLMLYVFAIEPPTWQQPAHMKLLAVGSMVRMLSYIAYQCAAPHLATALRDAQATVQRVVHMYSTGQQTRNTNALALQFDLVNAICNIDMDATQQMLLNPNKPSNLCNTQLPFANHAIPTAFIPKSIETTNTPRVEYLKLQDLVTNNFTLKFNATQHKKVTFSLVHPFCGYKLCTAIACLQRVEILTLQTETTFNLHAMAQATSTQNNEDCFIVSIIPFYVEWYHSDFMVKCSAKKRNDMLKSLYTAVVTVLVT